MKTLLLILQHFKHCPPFRVVPSTGDTPFPTFPPLLECFLERTFCDGAQFSCRIFLNLHLSLIRRTACTRAHFSGCSSTTNAHSETGRMAVCCQNLTLGALSSRSALSMMVGALFKKFGLFLNTVVLQTKPENNYIPKQIRFGCI
jgi:hypothetical protein